MESTDTETSRYTDIIERGVKRELPCKLTDEEELRIARQMVALKAELAEREGEWDLKAKKHKQEVAETERAIAKMERELHTGQQDRVVICNRVFERNASGGGDEVLIRLDPAHQLPGDTREVQRIPASASIMQRFLPFVGDAHGGGSVLDDARAQQAAAAQRSAAPEPDASDDVPGDDDASADDGEEDSPPAAQDDDPRPPWLREKTEGRAATEPATEPAPVCGLRYGKDGAACIREWKHDGEHDNGTNHWKARPPRKPLGQESA